MASEVDLAVARQRKAIVLWHLLTELDVESGCDCVDCCDARLLRGGIIARHLNAQPAVPVDAIARLVAIEEARAAIDHAGAEWADRYYGANDAIQPADCETVRAWLETLTEPVAQP